MTSPTARANAARRNAGTKTGLVDRIKRATAAAVSILAPANENVRPRLTASGYPLAVAKLRGAAPYKAPHAARGTAARPHNTAARARHRAASKVAYAEGLLRDAKIGIAPVYRGFARNGVEQRDWQRKAQRFATDIRKVA